MESMVQDIVVLPVSVCWLLPKLDQLLGFGLWHSGQSQGLLVPDKTAVRMIL